MATFDPLAILSLLFTVPSSSTSFASLYKEFHKRELHNLCLYREWVRSKLFHHNSSVNMQDIRQLCIQTVCGQTFNSRATTWLPKLTRISLNMPNLTKILFCIGCYKLHLISLSSYVLYYVIITLFTLFCWYIYLPRK